MSLKKNQLQHRVQGLQGALAFMDQGLGPRGGQPTDLCAGEGGGVWGTRQEVGAMAFCWRPSLCPKPG